MQSLVLNVTVFINIANKMKFDKGYAVQQCQLYMELFLQPMNAQRHTVTVSVRTWHFWDGCIIVFDCYVLTG